MDRRQRKASRDREEGEQRHLHLTLPLTWLGVGHKRGASHVARVSLSRSAAESRTNKGCETYPLAEGRD